MSISKKRTPKARAASVDIEAIRDQFRHRNPPLTEARIYARLLREKAAGSQRRLAKLIGVSQARISQRLALLQLPPQVLALMRNSGGVFTERHARELRGLRDPKLLIKLAEQIVKNELTVSQTQSRVRAMLEELGVPLGLQRPRAWRSKDNYRWRLHRYMLEIRVLGQDPQEQMEQLTALVPVMREELQKLEAARRRSRREPAEPRVVGG